MTNADDAVWIAAGGNRVEGSLATAARYETPVLPGTEHVAPVVHAVPGAPAAERPLATDPAPIGSARAVASTFEAAVRVTSPPVACTVPCTAARVAPTLVPFESS